MDIMDFIMDNALILIPVLYIIGIAMKKIPGIQDWLIPFVLFGLGIVGAVAIIGVTAEAFLQGILCAGAAVYVHQLIKQGHEGIVSSETDR